jgi:hypothetical protein
VFQLFWLRFEVNSSLLLKHGRNCKTIYRSLTSALAVISDVPFSVYWTHTVYLVLTRFWASNKLLTHIFFNCHVLAVIRSVACLHAYVKINFAFSRFYTRSVYQEVGLYYINTRSPVGEQWVLTEFLSDSAFFRTADTKVQTYTCVCVCVCVCVSVCLCVCVCVCVDKLCYNVMKGTEFCVVINECRCNRGV